MLHKQENTKFGFWRIFYIMLYVKFSFVCRGVPGGPKTLNEINDLSKLIQLGFERRFFFIPARKILCTGCSKTAVREGITKFFNISFHRGIRKKCWVVTKFQEWVA